MTRLLAIAADLGVADALADGPRPVDELAREVGADPDALHRILRALASDGVFAEEAPRVYRNTEASEGLRTIRAGALDDARLLVVDAVVPAGNDPHGAKFLDLLMLALFGARERDDAQWRALLGANWFEPVRIEDGLIEARCR